MLLLRRKKQPPSLMIVAAILLLQQYDGGVHARSAPPQQQRRTPLPASKIDHAPLLATKRRTCLPPSAGTRCDFALEIPRGGGHAASSAGIISLLPSKSTALKVFSTAYLLQGPVCLLAPRLNARLYGITIDKDDNPDTDAVVAFLMRASGSLILGLGVVSWLVQNVAGLGTSTSVALSNIFVAINLIFSMLQGVPGIPTTVFAIGIALVATGSALPVIAHATEGSFPSTIVATNYLKLYMAFGAVNGAAGALQPRLVTRVWKVLEDERLSQALATRTLFRTYGTWCLGYCLCCSWLLWRDEVASSSILTKALGLGSVPAFLLLLGGKLITKEFDQLGMHQGGMLFWFFFNLVFLTQMLMA